MRSKEQTPMTEQPLPLITFYQGWETYQRSLVETIAPLSSAQLAFPAASHHWTIGMLVQHMVANRVLWFQLWMGEGSPELAPIMRWDPGEGVEPPALEAAELVAGLETTWSLIQHCLARWTAADLDQTFQRRGGLVSRQWIIWHVIEHDLHHGGELFLTCGVHGLPVPDL